MRGGSQKPEAEDVAAFISRIRDQRRGVPDPRPPWGWEPRLSPTAAPWLCQDLSPTVLSPWHGQPKPPRSCQPPPRAAGSPLGGGCGIIGILPSPPLHSHHRFGTPSWLLPTPPNPNWEELGYEIGASILTGPSWGLGRDPPAPRVTSCPSVPAQACGGWEQHLLSCPMVQTGQRPPAQTGHHPLLFPSLSCPKEVLRNLGRFFPEGRNSHDQDLLAPRHSRHLTALHGGRVLVP